MDAAVDAYFNKAEKWKGIFHLLRTIIHDCQLEESLKWGKPCYSYKGSNIVIIQGFKAYCALMFFKGVLLKDEHNVLIQIGENTQSARQIRFTQEKEVEEMKEVISHYIKEAVELEKMGAEVVFKPTSEYASPEEFQKMMDEEPELKSAFYALTPGRQRGYLLYFSQPKQSKTKISRIEKCVSKILNGQGINDK